MPFTPLLFNKCNRAYDFGFAWCILLDGLDEGYDICLDEYSISLFLNI